MKRSLGRQDLSVGSESSHQPRSDFAGYVIHVLDPMVDVPSPR